MKAANPRGASRARLGTDRSAVDGVLTRLVIVGAGGFGRQALDVVEAINAVERRWEFLGFLDDSTAHDPLVARRGAAILGTVVLLASIDTAYVIAIADPKTRERVDTFATQAGRQPATLIHPAAVQGTMNMIGPGFTAMAGSCISTGLTIGRHVHLGQTATVGHDALVGDFATIYPGAHISGKVTLEDSVSIGTGANIIQGLTIGRHTFVGAGAVVTRSLPGGIVAVGVPARERRR